MANNDAYPKNSEEFYNFVENINSQVGTILGDENFSSVEWEMDSHTSGEKRMLMFSYMAEGVDMTFWFRPNMQEVEAEIETEGQENDQIIPATPEAIINFIKSKS